MLCRHGLGVQGESVSTEGLKEMLGTAVVSLRPKFD